MPKFKVLISDKLSDDGVAVFKADPEVQVDIKLKMTPEQLQEAIGDYDALVIRSDSRVTPEVLARAKRLKVVGRAGVGLDNVDIPAATKAGVIVMNTPDGNTISAAEHTMALMLSMARSVPQAHASLKDKKWERGKFMGVEMYGKTLGVIGLGRIGGEVAKRARAFGMRILAFDPYCSAEKAGEIGAELTSIPEILKQADFITVHVPKTKETSNLLGAKELASCKKGVRLINVARGGIYDEKALAEAIVSGHVAGAAMDVFTEEPPTGNPLLDLPQVIVTPHLGASTEEAQNNVAVVVAKQILDALHGRTVANAVNLPSIDLETWRKIKPQVDLAEKLGAFASQLAPGRLEKVGIEYVGGPQGFKTNPLTLVVLKGLLMPSLGDMVNLVNAPFLAKERGITVSESQVSESSDYTNLIRLTVEGEAGKHSLIGTVMGKRDTRIVEIDGYRMDINPSGNLILFFNRDTPGIVGKVASILGEAKINISGLTNGRKAKGGDAVSVFQVDEDVPAEVLKKVAAVEGVKDERVVRL